MEEIFKYHLRILCIIAILIIWLLPAAGCVIGGEEATEEDKTVSAKVVPEIFSLNPAEGNGHLTPFKLQVFGSNFRGEACIHFNGIPQESYWTPITDSNQTSSLFCIIGKNDIFPDFNSNVQYNSALHPSKKQIQIFVTNSGPDGEKSNVLYYTINHGNLFKPVFKNISASPRKSLNPSMAVTSEG